MINNLDLSDSLKFQYSVNKPFPHIIIDNFFNESILSHAIEELKKFEDWGHDPTEYVKAHQINKEFTPWNPDCYEHFKTVAPNASYVLNYLNSNITLNYLENLTGIQNLLADNSWMGAGIHRIHSGGKLDVHIDYNWHKHMEAHRRINLLLYLNKDWKKEWGGDLELWEKDLSRKSIEIAPIFNRVVIFNITDEAYHGHPIPMTSPEGTSRYSFALYYFTKDRPQQEINPPHDVIWK